MSHTYLPGMTLDAALAVDVPVALLFPAPWHTLDDASFEEAQAALTGLRIAKLRRMPTWAGGGDDGVAPTFLMPTKTTDLHASIVNNE